MTLSAEAVQVAPHRVPAMYLCLEVVPAPATAVPDECGTAEIFGMVADEPAAFHRTFRVFRTLYEAEEHAKTSPTLDIVPLVVEPNGLLGF